MTSGGDRNSQGEPLGAIRRSELRYRTLVEATSAITWSCPPSGLHVEPQPLWMAFTGQSAEEMLGAGWAQAVHPDDRAAAAQRWAEAVARGDVFASEHRIRRHDGAWRWMRVHAVPIRDAAGDIVEWFGVNVDTTESKETEEALRQTRDMFAQAQSIAHLGSFQYEVATGATLWSEEEYRIYGLDPAGPSPGFDDMLARCIHPDDAAALRETFLGAVSRRAVCDFMHRIVRPDGSIRWVHQRARPDLDGSGRPVRYVGATLDITERKELEETLAHERERFQRALEAAPIAILMTDADGGIVLANPTLQDLFGYTADELRGRPVEMLVPPALRERHLTLRNTFLAAPSRRRMGQGRRLTGQRKDGSEFPIEVGLGAVVVGGKTLTVAAIADVSSHEAAISRQDQARRAAEAASEAKTRFLANVSHELRTPLNAVLGLNEVLRQGGVTPRQSELLAKQQAAGRHLLQVIDAMLDLAKIRSGKQELAARKFRLEDVVRVVTDMAQEAASARGLRIDVRVAPGQPVFVGDDTRLQQALLNYLGNAVKFSDAGTITVRAYPLEASNHDVLLRFEVQDEGIGIAADVLERLFEAFTQADSSSTRKFGGTGLGLAITRGIAEMMGGAAGAQSVSGHGSTFWFTARVEVAPPETTPAATPEPPAVVLRRRHAGRQVLLAEDDPVSAEIAEFILRAAGLQVTVATHGAQAVAMAAARQFDLILMDLTMPGMDGLEAARRIRSGPGASHAPIVALTANAFAEDRDACLAAGMVDLVSKPVDATKLCSAALRWLDGSPRVGPDDGSDTGLKRA